jgi:hypothetical protein
MAIDDKEIDFDYASDLPGWGALGEHQNQGSSITQAHSGEGSQRIAANMAQRQQLREAGSNPFSYDTVLNNLAGTQPPIGQERDQVAPQQMSDMTSVSPNQSSTNVQSQQPAISANDMDDAQLQNFIQGSLGSGGGSMGGSGKVLCTLAFEQGYLTPKTYAADCMFAHDVDIEVKKGYWLWAVPLVRFLERKPSFMCLVMPIVKSWAKHMSYMMNCTKEFSPIGYVLHHVGCAVCRTLSKIKGDK